ncbi:cytochrome c biogenesis protein DipZ [Bdellovibrio bacteriovorus]
MLLFILSYLGGLLTILSPCILPVLPFVFAKADQPFRKSGLPLLIGMALTFAAFSGLAVLGGIWAVQLNQWGRWLAIILLTIFGLSLIFPQFFERFYEPFNKLGAKLTTSVGKEPSVFHSIVLGAATGLLWAPCAGPILGLILTGAATQESPVESVWFLFAYALGAATSLMLALVAGGKFLNSLKKTLPMERKIKTGLGVAVLAGVVVIVFNLDRTILTQISKLQTEKWESYLVEVFRPAKPLSKSQDGETAELISRITPNLQGGTKWFNSPTLTLGELRGKVVLIDFWTYSCINCLRTLPYIKAWHEKYKDMGLVIIGVHTPEFAFEKDPLNVAKAIEDLKITYPVVMDNDYQIWNTFENNYWPAHYFIDRKGVIRAYHHGEGKYEASEKVIQDLLKEDGSTEMDSKLVQVEAKGVAAPAQFKDIKTPETYVGFRRAENRRLQPYLKQNQEETYVPVSPIYSNEWTMAGTWLIEEDSALLTKPGGRIHFKYHARDLHLVLGPKEPGAKIRFKVTIDGKPPGKDRGLDVDANGFGTVTENRLYQLIRQSPEKEVKERTFEIEFLDSGVQAFAFTFG